MNKIAQHIINIWRRSQSSATGCTLPCERRNRLQMVTWHVDEHELLRFRMGQSTPRQQSDGFKCEFWGTVELFCFLR